MQSDSVERPSIGREATRRGFRDLRVWQSAIELVKSVYLVTRGFPREEIYGLTSQMRRAAVSIPSNIAEGQARDHLREYLHHLSMAQGSTAELKTQIEIAAQLDFLSPEQGQRLTTQATSVARQLRALREALAARRDAIDGDLPARRSPSPKPETRNPKPRDHHPC